MTEQVLVLPRAAVPGGCDFHGIRAAAIGDLSRLREAVRDHGRYVERARAEDDPGLKQLIPYVVVLDGERIFLMRRTDAGGDARLHGKGSIGVGGHLNPVDEGEDPLMSGLRREWDEELEASWKPEFTLVGMLNDDTNPVGTVHLGIVFVVEAAGRKVGIRETHKLAGAFAPPGEVLAARDELETWSRLVADVLLHGPVANGP